jgi:hypothetical protein
MHLTALTAAITWLAFAVVFSALARHHFIAARERLPNYEGKARVAAIFGTPTGVPEVEQAFNAHIERLNEANAVANRRAACGYVLAALTAVFSAALEFREPEQVSPAIATLPTRTAQHAGAPQTEAFAPRDLRAGSWRGPR